MGLRCGRRCKELLGWSLAERTLALTPQQGILTQQIKTLTKLSGAVTQRTQPKTVQKNRAYLSTSQSVKAADQSTFGACLNRTVDDRIFGLTEEERELRATIQQFCKREIRPLAEVRSKKKNPTGCPKKNCG